ncbi:MAG: hypothetical protein IJ345_08020 [Clostridia bacterium]|nr:hypothetical protein [Clostridia bacterium]
MSIFQKKNKNHWEIETATGKHQISVQMGAASRDPMSIHVDGKYVATAQYSGSGLIPMMEHKFLCDGEPVTLILYGSELDLAYHGKLVRGKFEYPSNQELPIWMRILFIILTVAAVSECFIAKFVFLLPVEGSVIGLSLLLSLVCVIITINKSTSPFKSKQQKIKASLLSALWAWFCVFVFTALFAMLSTMS